MKLPKLAPYLNPMVSGLSATGSVLIAYSLLNRDDNKNKKLLRIAALTGLFTFFSIMVFHWGKKKLNAHQQKPK